ncbi:efflux RND transporter periplasmic adaptor subunit [Paenibacillus sp. PCH8]|uniref:efflux RND transporter periplasmic adaptor subunit n=1 Tax=Paenibacillus sp. PCH8 TaxID=2066524 RepID=UPI000CF9AE9F|nr:efflux RND transporter periplasmic adaptor subunit [Paenibacillus sp. PCH8]PQP83195.1 efflux RND transporter periplasmic adaptor subunit [Paenibacillus sp. PCH8]
MKKWINITITVVLLAGVGYWLYDMYKPKPEAPVEIPPPITFEVTQETMTQSIQVKGKSVYTDQTDVFAPYTSSIKQWHVKSGEQVKKGDILFTLDTSALQTEIDQMQSDLAKARLDVEINQVSADQANMSETLGVTEEERKKAFVEREGKRLTNELNQKALGLKEQEVQKKQAVMAKAVVYASASGIFQMNEEDSKTRAVTEGQLMGSITNISKLKFMTIVGEEEMFRLKVGMPVQVRMTAQKDLKFTGKVSKVSKFARKSTDTDLKQASQFDVVIDMKPDERMYGGVSLEGDIETLRKAKATVVSSLAIMRDQPEPYVLLDKGHGQTEQLMIQAGIESGDKTEVVSGLKPGDIVVIP